MKRVRSILLCIVALGLPVCVLADEAAPPTVEEPAAEKEWSFDVSFDWFNIYLFRGVDLLDNDFLYNPHAAFAWKGFSVWYWGAFGDADPGHVPGGHHYEENDYGADYTHAFFDEKLSITAGVQMFHYPDAISGKDTYEVYGIAAWDVMLAPTVTFYWDFWAFHGGYGTFGISHSFDLSEKLGLKEPMTLSIDPSAAVGVNFGYNSRRERNKPQWNDILVGVTIPWTICEGFSVHAGVQFSIAMDALNDIAQHNETVGNVGATISF